MELPPLVSSGSTWDHLIPQVYLKAWRDPQAGKPAKVWLVRKDDLHGCLQSCKQILRELGFYLTVDYHGNVSNETERFLGLSESRIGAIRKQLEAWRYLPESDRTKLWEFVVGMFVRTKTWREQIEKLGTAAFNVYAELARTNPAAFVKEFIPAPRSQVLPKHMKRTLALRLVRTARPAVERSARLLARSLHSRAIYGAINAITTIDLAYCVVHSDSDGFLASDAPSFLEEPSILDVPREHGPGAVWFMPLSPKIVFAGGVRVQQTHISANSEWVARFNHRLRCNADLWLVSSKPETSEAGFKPMLSDPPSTRELLERAALNAINKKRA